MSPIKDLSDIRRMPRLGKIRLGVKVSPQGKNPYPRAADHFVVPPAVQAVYGAEPRELDIMFPTEEPEHFAQQWLRRYSLTQGLTCIGDGLTCRRKFDRQTGAMVTRDTREWVWKDGLICNPQECPEYTRKFCRRVMNLQFLLPEVEGLGVWQIDTSSFYSIVNINSMVEMLKATLGRCSMLPLKLVLGTIEVTPPGENKKTVFIMHVSTGIKLGELAKLAQLPPARALLPEPETEEPPEDLYPPEVLAEQDETPGGAQTGAPAMVKNETAEPEAKPEATGDFSVEDEELFPANDPTLLRQEIAHLLKGPHPSDARLKAWWDSRKWGYGLQARFFNSTEALPGMAKPEHLIAFRDALKQYQETAAAKKSQQPSLDS